MIVGIGPALLPAPTIQVTARDGGAVQHGHDNQKREEVNESDRGVYPIHSVLDAVQAGAAAELTEVLLFVARRLKPDAVLKIG